MRDDSPSDPREARSAADKDQWIGFVCWLVLGIFVAYGVDRILGEGAAAAFGIAWVFTLGWFMEHAPSLFGR